MFRWIKNHALLAFITGLVLTIVVLVMLPSSMPELSAPEPRIYTATTVEISPQQQPMQMTVASRMRAVKQSAIRSLVSGRVIWIHPGFRNGARLKAGTTVVRIDATELRAQVENARLQLAQAEVSLLEQQREAARAIANWQRVNNALPEDPFISRELQVKLAEQQVATAKALLEQARVQLSYSEIRIPFDGEIAQRTIAEGEWLAPEQEVAGILSSADLEINVQLSPAQWSSLVDDMADAEHSLQAWVLDENGEALWPLVVNHLANSVTEATQLRSIYFRYLHDAGRRHPLAGQWVKVRVQGKMLNRLWPVPHSALTRDGGLWWVDSDSRLQKMPVERVFMTDETAYIRLRDGLPQTLTIAKYPQNYFVAGRRIKSQPVNGEGQ